MELVSKLTRHLSSLEEIRNQVLFFPNDTLFKVTDFYSYIESKIENNRKVYFKSTAAYNDSLSHILAFCKNGQYLDNMVAFLEDDGFEKQESFEYINSLIDNQILTSSLEISTANPNPFATLIFQLEQLKEKSTFLHHFIRESKNILNAFQKKSFPNLIESIKTNENVFQFINHECRNVF